MPKGVYVRGENSKWSNSRGTPEQQFWKRVNKDGPVHPICGQCWLWTGGTYKTRGGYGQFRGMRAHRFSYLINIGEIVNDLYVLHKCDNVLCVNPDHLFLGTPQDNMTDKKQKGRATGGTKSPCYGEKNGRYKHGLRCKK